MSCLHEISQKHSWISQLPNDLAVKRIACCECEVWTGLHVAVQKSTKLHPQELCAAHRQQLRAASRSHSVSPVHMASTSQNASGNWQAVTTTSSLKLLNCKNCMRLAETGSWNDPLCGLYSLYCWFYVHDNNTLKEEKKNFASLVYMCVYAIYTNT